MRTTCVPYPSAELAVRDERAFSPWYLSLGGEWAFDLLDNLDALTSDMLTGNGRHRIDVPGCWQTQGYDYPQYINVAMPIPFDPPHIPDDTPVGVYRRSFWLPESFAGRRVRLRMEGVDSCAYVFVNRQFCGFTKCSHLTAEFDITGALTTGENQIAIVVLKWSDGTYLEDQDKWRMSGIFRDIALISHAEAHVEDITVSSALEQAEGGWLGRLDVAARVTENARVTFALTFGGRVLKECVQDSQNGEAHWRETFDDIAPWTAETPNLYSLVVACAEQYDHVRVGFRSVEARDGVLKVNGSPVKIKGVNRHDFHASLGFFTPLGHMLDDVLLMKKSHVNAVRTSHYPADPRFLDLCDQYGLYVVGEADLECHGAICTGNYDRLSDDAEWEEQYVDRGIRMVQRDRNHPSVIIWSLGNESGYGRNHRSMAKAMRDVDASRPVQYELDTTCETTDLFAPMYVELEQLEAYGSEVGQKPLLMPEYAHAMGQGPGGLSEYWRIIYQYPRLAGGFIWEWVDQAIQERVDGKTRYRFGSDYPVAPNDGFGCVDGLCYPDRRPHTGLIEYAHVIAPAQLSVTLCENGSEAIARVQNRFDFNDLACFSLNWRIVYRERTIAGGACPLSVKPGEALEIPISLCEYPKGSLLELACVYRADTTYARANEIAVMERFSLPGGIEQPHIAPRAASLALRAGKESATVVGAGFSLGFSRRAGGLTSFVFNGCELLNAPINLNLWRALTSNDRGAAFLTDSAEKRWQRLGLRSLRTRVTVFDARMPSINEARVVIESVHSPDTYVPIIRFRQTFSVYSDGTVMMSLRYTPLRDMTYLPRLGVRFQMPRKYDSLTWFGRGPHESYPDKKSGAALGWYKRSVEETHEPYIVPQENGSHEDTRYLTLTDQSGRGLMIMGNRFAFSAHHYTPEQLGGTQHNDEICTGEFTQVLLDGAMGPLGSNSCGPEPQKALRLTLKDTVEYRFALRGVDWQSVSEETMARYVSEAMERRKDASDESVF